MLLGLGALRVVGDELPWRHGIIVRIAPKDLVPPAHPAKNKERRAKKRFTL